MPFMTVCKQTSKNLFPCVGLTHYDIPQPQGASNATARALITFQPCGGRVVL